MAKIGKVKFNELGGFMPRTTFHGKLEIYVYYDNQTDCFYFQDKDVKDMIGISISYSFFKGCKSKNEAIGRMEILMTDMNPEKYLSIEMETNFDSGVYKTMSDEVKKSNFWSRNNTSRQKQGILKLKYERVVKVKSVITGKDIFYNCNEFTWKPEKWSVTENRSLFIKWTEEREKYFDDITKKINQIGTDIMVFMNEGVESGIENYIDEKSEMFLKLNK